MREYSTRQGFGIPDYDHRLRDLVRISGDATIVGGSGVPRSTIPGWRRGDQQSVTSADVFEMGPVHLRIELSKLRLRNRKLAAVVRLLYELLRALDIRLDQRRLSDEAAKALLLHAKDQAQRVLSLRGVLHDLGRSPSRHHRWRRADATRHASKTVFARAHVDMTIVRGNPIPRLRSLQGTAEHQRATSARLFPSSTPADVSSLSATRHNHVECSQDGR